jgi:endonuclease YncB( thermonuclease family)
MKTFLLLLLLATGAFAQYVIHGRCVAVSDGDTIKVLATGRELLRIRVAWIDCPELGQAFGKPHAIDRYGRTVAMVFVDGRDVGLELIKVGLAWAYEYYLPEASSQIHAQYTAAETASCSSKRAFPTSGIAFHPRVGNRSQSGSTALSANCDHSPVYQPHEC